MVCRFGEIKLHNVARYHNLQVVLGVKYFPWALYSISRQICECCEINHLGYVGKISVGYSQKI